MTKYIVKNCPSYFRGGCYGCDNLCQNINNCQIKQMVELCMNYPEKPDNSLSNRILQTLQVEEVE